MESDDEYDRNPYKYARDTAEFSDESDDGNKHPWSKKPKWWKKADSGSDDEDEDDSNDDG